MRKLFFLETCFYKFCDMKNEKKTIGKLIKWIAFCQCYQKFFVCVCVSVCIQARGRYFYPIDTKFGTHVGLLNDKVQFEDELCESHKGS